MRGEPMHQYFIDKGLKANLDITSTHENNIRKLFRERFDLITGNELSLRYQIKKYGFSSEAIEKAFPLVDKGGYYMAVNRQTSIEIVEKLEAAFNELQNSGKLQLITGNWLR